MSNTGQEMYDLCQSLFPICRSITGNGLRKSLEIIKNYIPNLSINEIPSGTKCFDWEIPLEWNIKDCYIIDPDGQKICNFKDSNLHVVGYSYPVNQTMTLDELQNHLYSLPEQPNAIPYITSYYKEQWGFCITHNQRKKLKSGEYQVYIDSELKQGSLTYGELIISGKTDKEIFLSTYLCHPSMANNELSGPAVTTFLAKWLTSITDNKFTYRIIIIPETIGSIAYLSQNHKSMIKNIIAGFNITCIGDNRSYSFLPSRIGNSLSDQIAQHVLKHLHPEYNKFSFLDRGSDERQYCSPGINLPVCSIMRTKYACYPEYHTSLDNLDLISPEGLWGGFNVLKKSIECLERNTTHKMTVKCEPQLGKRGLYPTMSTKDTRSIVENMMNYLAYADGTLTTIEIAEKIDVPMWELNETIDKLEFEGLLKKIE